MNSNIGEYATLRRATFIVKNAENTLFPQGLAWKGDKEYIPTKTD